MSFRDDFIAAAYADADRAANIYTALTDDQKYGVKLFKHLADNIQTATTVRLRGDQAQVFLDTPSVGEQNYVEWLRLPFDTVYVQLDAPIKFSGYLSELDAGAPGNDGSKENADLSGMKPDPAVRGIFLAQSDRPSFLAKLHETIANRPKTGADPTTTQFDDSWKTPENLVRVIQAHFIMPTATYLLNVHTAALFITRDNQLVFSKKGFWETRVRMIDWTVHFANFLASPSIKLVRQEPDVKLQRARISRGKAPLPGWYEITMRKHINDYTKSKIAEGKKWEHSYRYDVAGHMKRFTRGRMTGRVVWVPKHQRGLKHDLYKPKGYRLDDRDLPGAQQA